MISAVSGAAGVGRTALAVHWAHRVRSRFPDGQLYVDPLGSGRTGSSATGAALRDCLEALGHPADRIPEGMPAQATLYAPRWPSSASWWCSTTRAMPARSGR